MRHNGDDDYGLPRVDVVIPDDARELDSDLAAWRREERRHKQQARIARMLGPLARHGIAGPLIAGALVIALVSGTLMTFFGPRAAVPPTSMTAMVPPTNSPGEIGGQLPVTTVEWGGAKHSSTEMRFALIVIVPGGCDCSKNLVDLANMIYQAHQRIHLYLVADRRPANPAEPDRTVRTAHRELVKLARPIHSVVPVLVDDVSADRSRQLAERVRAKRLTVLLVHAEGLIVDIRRDLTQIVDLNLGRVMSTT